LQLSPLLELLDVGQSPVEVRPVALLEPLLLFESQPSNPKAITTTTKPT
jgi:hypothetical protein